MGGLVAAGAEGAVARAGEERAAGSVAASDAFFPFADGPQLALDAGITALIQPGYRRTFMMTLHAEL